MQKLNYLEVAEQGDLVIDTGEVDIEEMGAVHMAEPGKGGFVRVFVPQDKKRHATPSQSQLMLLSHISGVLEALAVQNKSRPTVYSRCVALEKHKDHLGYFLSYDPHAHLIGHVEGFDARAAKKDVLRWLSDHARSTEVLVQLCASESDLVDLTKGLHIKLADALGGITRRPADTPSDNPVSVVSRRRELAKDWLTAAEVNGILGSVAANVRQKPARLRREGKLLGVWVEAENRYRYPGFQFSDDGLQKEIAELLSHLPDDNGSGWGRIQWLYTPHALLEKRRPVEVFQDDPGAVLEAARRQYEKGRDGSW